MAGYRRWIFGKPYNHSPFTEEEERRNEEKSKRLMETCAQIGAEFRRLQAGREQPVNVEQEVERSL